MLESQLFAGDAILEAVAADQTRINRTLNNVFDTVVRLQAALLLRRPDCLPVFGADGNYGDEAAGAVVQLKIEEFPDLAADQIFDDVGPRTVVLLDGIAKAAEEVQPLPSPPSPPPPPPPPPPVPPTAFVRQDIWAIDTDPNQWHPIAEAYAKAVGVMMSRPGNDPTSWSFQAAIHGTISQATDQRMNSCQHGNWFFLPWHRMYLFFLEQIVRDIVMAQGGPADFAVPYWNYEGGGLSARLPLAFRRPTLTDGSPNPLVIPDPGRPAGWNSGTFAINTSFLNSQAAMREPRFVLSAGGIGFGGGAMTLSHSSTSPGLIESNPHNGVHSSFSDLRQFRPCAGFLMNFASCAALDPVFWLHHANIDRLWNTWQANVGGSNPADTIWLDQSFEFADTSGAVAVLSVRQILNSRSDLGYVYDDIPNFALAAPTPAPQGAPMRLLAATDSVMAITNEPQQLDMVVADDIADVVASLLDGASELFLNVEDIQAEGGAGIGYQVFVNLDDPFDETQRSQRLAGSISLFGIELRNDPDSDHQGTGGMQFAFNVSDLARELLGLGALDPTRWSIRVEPVSLIVSDDPSLLPDLADLPEVRIGRISLFVN